MGPVPNKVRISNPEGSQVEGLGLIVICFGNRALRMSILEGTYSLARKSLVLQRCIQV